MTPVAIIEAARVDGVNLFSTEAGTIKATGEHASVRRWLPLIRKQKPQILAVLCEATPLTAKEEAKIHTWLAHIEETDPDIIAEVLEKCRANTESRWYFLHRAEEIPQQDVYDRSTTCGECSYFQRIDHPNLGHCAKGQPEAIAGLWDTDRRKCSRWQSIHSK